jgi:hypothetical protein
MHSIQIVPQTKVAAIGYFFIFMSSLIVLNVLQPELRRYYGVKILILAISIPITLYGINCTVIGKCETYAWIYGYLLFSYGLLTILLLLFSSTK